MRILGIDPGSRITGYGIIDSEGGQLRYLGSGVIALRGAMAARLGVLYRELSTLISDYHPETCAIEAGFVYKNPDSALKLAQARGVAIAACAVANCTVAEYAPRLVKQTVTGVGSAEKSQVQKMVKLLLGAAGELSSDSADALAVAITHAHCGGRP